MTEANPLALPCPDCAGTMHPTPYQTPVGRRYECDKCGMSAPRTTIERKRDRSPFIFKRAQAKA